MNEAGNQGGMASAVATRLKALKTKHNDLSENIERMQQSPSSPDYYIRSLKRQKLMLKDEMQDLHEKIEKMRKAAAN